MVSAATAQAVIASISTPVLASHRTMPRTSIVPAPRSRSKVMSTELTGTGCVSGIRFGVCLAASTPATLAVVRTSPFGSACSTSLVSVSGFMRTVATATASRTVTRLLPTSTMEMPPVSSRWENSRVMQVLRSVHVEQLVGLLVDDIGDQAAQVEPPLRDALVDAREECGIVARAEHVQLVVGPRRHEQRSRGLEPRAQTSQQLRAEPRVIAGENEAPPARVLQRAAHAEHRRGILMRLLEDGPRARPPRPTRPLHGIDILERAARRGGDAIEKQRDFRLAHAAR